MNWLGGDWLRPDWVFGPWPDAAAQAFEALQKAARLTKPDGWPIGPAATIQSVAGAARFGLIGRPVTLRLGSTEVRLTLTDLVVQPDPIGAAFGQFDDVRLTAREVQWDRYRLKELAVVCRNVHLRLGAAATLVAAPIEIEATLDQSAADSWLSGLSGRIAVRLGDDRTVRVEIAGRTGLGHLAVEPHIDGGMIRLAPTWLVAFGRQLRLAGRLPAIRLRLPDLPRGMRLTDIQVGEGDVRVAGVIDEWRETISASQLLELSRRLRRPGARVEVPRLTVPED